MTWQYFTPFAINGLVEDDITPNNSANKGGSASIRISAFLMWTVCPLNSIVGREAANLYGIMFAYVSAKENTGSKGPINTCVDAIDN